MLVLETYENKSILTFCSNKLLTITTFLKNSTFIYLLVQQTRAINKT